MAPANIPNCVSLFFLLLIWRPSHGDVTRISTNLLDQRLTKDQALEACERINVTSRSSLPTYDTADEQSVVSRTMTNNNIQQVWLGMHKESFPIWMWLDNQPVGKDLASQKWPDYMNCGILHLRDATLEMDDCSIHLGFLCQIPHGTCSDLGISHVECVDMQPHSYVYQCSVSNWYAARQKCQDDGLELAVIRSEEAMANLTRVWYRNNRRPCVKLWVGLRHHEWRYTGRLESTAPGIHWGSGEPSQSGNCAVVSKSGKFLLWKTVSCTSLQNTVCVINTTVLAPINTSAVPVSMTTPAPVSKSAEVPEFSTVANRSITRQHPRGSGPHVGFAVGFSLYFLVLVAAVVLIFTLLKRKTTEEDTPPKAKEDEESMAEVPEEKRKMVAQYDERPYHTTTQPDDDEREAEPTANDPLICNENNSECDSGSVSPGIKQEREEKRKLTAQYVQDGHFHIVEGSALDLYQREWETSKTFDSSGGALRVSGSNILLKVPEEAVAEGEEVSITMEIDTDIAKYKSDIKQGEMVVVPIIIITMDNSLSEQAVLEIPYVKFDQHVFNFYDKNERGWNRLLYLKGASPIIKYDDDKIYKFVLDSEMLMVTCKVPENPVSRWQACVYTKYFQKNGFQEFELRIYVFDEAHIQSDFFTAFKRREKLYKVKEGMQIDIETNFSPTPRDMVRCGIELTGEGWTCNENEATEEKTVADITDKHITSAAASFEFVVQAGAKAEDSVRVDIEFDIRPKSDGNTEQETPECATKPSRHTLRICAEDVTQHQDVMNDFMDS